MICNIKGIFLTAPNLAIQHDETLALQPPHEGFMAMFLHWSGSTV